MLFYAAKAALVRINRLNSLKQEPHYPHLENPFMNKKTVAIRVDNLHFSYGEEKILNGIQLKIKAGEKVALVGASGGAVYINTNPDRSLPSKRGSDLL